MARLYVRNVPDDLYEALRNRAKSQHRSIAAEVLILLEQNVPTAKELKKRRAFLKKLTKMRSFSISGRQSLPSSEEFLREDRDR